MWNDAHFEMEWAARPWFSAKNKYGALSRIDGAKSSVKGKDFQALQM